MEKQEVKIKKLAKYFMDKMPNEGWDYFEYRNGIDNPERQRFTILGDIHVQGISAYSFEPKESNFFNKNDIYKNLNIMEIGKILYEENAPIDSEGNEIWNTFSFQLNKDGSYEGRFFWDDTRFLKDVERQVKGMPDYIIQTTQYDIWEVENWTNADVIINVVDNKIDCMINYYDNNVLINTITLPLDNNTYEYILFAYTETNNGLLKDKLEHWNKLTIKVFHDNYYFKNEYAQYEVTEN
jgi:hypothetical protein